MYLMSFMICVRFLPEKLLATGNTPTLVIELLVDIRLLFLTSVKRPTMSLARRFGVDSIAKCTAFEMRLEHLARRAIA